MPFLDCVRQRRLQPEVMDQPGLDPVRHREALRGLERINLLSASAGILWPSLAALARRTAPRPLRVLDVAAGGGDVPIQLWRRASRSKLALEIEGCDVNPEAVAYATDRATAKGANVRFFIANVLDGPLPTGYDVICCSLFLHHLNNEQAVDFLRRAAEAAGRMILINDLERCRTGLLLAYLAAWTLTLSPIVRVDGPRSVEGAFTREEALALAQQAGLHGARVVRRWPFRYLLSWSKP